MITRIGLICLIIAATAFAQGKGKGKGRGNGGGHRGGGDAYASYNYGATDRGMINDYYGNPGVQLPPGLAKKGKVPPGWRKKLMAFPPDLDRRLPPLPYDCGDCRRGIYGNEAVVMRGDTIIDRFAIALGNRYLR